MVGLLASYVHYAQCPMSIEIERNDLKREVNQEETRLQELGRRKSRGLIKL